MLSWQRKFLIDIIVGPGSITGFWHAVSPNLRGLAMNDPGKQIPELDRLIHEPARLAILTVLNSCRSADFLFLLRVTGLSKGNLSVQLTRLEEAGFISMEKCFVDKKTRTTVSLSRHGSQELARYWDTVDRLRSFTGGADDKVHR